MENEPSREEAGARIRAAREAAGYGLREAAKKLGIPHVRLSEMERGGVVTSWTRLVGMVVTLGLDPELIVPEFFQKKKKK